jgi:hypothetical protein
MANFDDFNSFASIFYPVTGRIVAAAWNVVNFGAPMASTAARRSLLKFESSEPFTNFGGSNVSGLLD